MPENKWERVPYAEHIDRCQGVDSKGQCWLYKLPPSQFCHRHGGNRAGEEARKREVQHLQANAFLQKVREGARSPDLLSLATEVAAIKQMMEIKMSQMIDASTIEIHSGSLANLCVQSEKLVTSCTRLQEKLGNMMSATQAMEFATEIMGIVSEEVGDGETLERIQQRVLAALETLEGKAKLGRREAG